jgi:AhpC/TSA family
MSEGDTRYAKIPRPPGASRYGWFVAVVVFLALVYITINTATTDRQSSTGITAGSRMPPFAVPLALSGLNGDANIATKPNQKSAGARPACEVRGGQILNVCQLYERGPVALAFFATRGAQCESQLDRLQALRNNFPTIAMAAVAIRGDRDDVRRDVRRHGWRFPVGYDRDGVLANLYGVAVCPQITLADRGGRVVKTLIGQRATPALRRELGALARRAQ